MTSGGRRGQSAGHDELLARLYQQFTEQQSGDFGREHDFAAGAAAVSHNGATPRFVDPGSTGTTAAIPSRTAGIDAGTEADRMVAQLHRTHYRSLVKLAAVLVTDVATAEEIVQDSFVAMHAACSRPAGNADALAYLHHAVVRRCDAAARHGDAAESLSPPIAADARGVISVLRALPPRQREVLLLRFHAELSEAQVASAMGTSKSAVRSHTARAISALHAGLCVAGN